MIKQKDFLIEKTYIHIIFNLNLFFYNYFYIWYIWIQNMTQ